MRAFSILAVTCSLLACPVHAQMVYRRTPDWVSADTPVSTGAALVDLDRDGWPDFVVGNGNDILRQELAVYYNRGDGTYPLTPDWLSSDQEYNGHLSVADVDGDGWQDVAVGLTMQDFGTPTARVYLNNAGTLSSLPDWSTPDDLAAFHVAFGDVNGDGRPDLAVGTGWPYSGGNAWHNHVYMNVGGVLEATPSWISDDTLDFGDIFFCDADGDGWLDLVGVGEGTDTWVYLNEEGTLATTAVWHTADNPNQFSVMGTYGDVDGDGRADLFTTDNTQLQGGDGLLRRYDGLAGGLFTTTPTWTYYKGYGSAVALADVDADGALDLITGSWWGAAHYFLNAAGLYPPVPDWSSTATSVVEAIVFGDVNRDGLQYPVESFDVTSTPGRHLFQLPHQPIEGVESVVVDDVPLGPDEFTFDPVHGWVSVGPTASASVVVNYVHSVRPDMAVTNWDSSVGNFLYYHSDAACAIADAPLPEAIPVAKNRHLSFSPGNSGRWTGIRVTLTDLPAPFNGWNNVQLFVGEPRQVCENSGQGLNTSPPNCGPAPGLPQRWAWYAPLVCDPQTAHLMDWSTLVDHCVDGSNDGDECSSDGDCPGGSCGSDGAVHLYHEGIVPSHMASSTGPIDGPAVYAVQVIDAQCSLNDEDAYSDTLTLVQAGWGDSVLDVSACPNEPPDGRVDVVTDLTALLNKFTNLNCAPLKARADLQPHNVDFKIDISDLVLCLGAFTGDAYPFGAGNCYNERCSGGPDHGMICEQDSDCSSDLCP